jgi:hypothetical protein
LLIRAELEFEEDRARLIAGQAVVNGRASVEELANIAEKWPASISVELSLDRLEGAMSAELLFLEMAGVIKKYPGPIPVLMRVRKAGMFQTQLDLGVGYRVQPQKTLIEELNRMVAIPGCLRAEAVY